MIHATAKGSYAREQGSKAVLVGIIDTGVDGGHPDIAPNFDAQRGAATSPSITSGRSTGRAPPSPTSLLRRPGERGRERPRHARGRDDRGRR